MSIRGGAEGGALGACDNSAIGAVLGGGHVRPRFGIAEGADGVKMPA